MPRQPALQVEPEGTISFEWEAAEHGWLTLTVDGQGSLAHSAVFGEDSPEQVGIELKPATGGGPIKCPR